MGTYRVDQIMGRVADRRLSRRRALRAGGAALAVASLAPSGSRADPVLGQGTPAAATPEASPVGQAAPVTGRAVPELAAFDRAVAELMATWGVPGAQLSVAKDGRLVLDRGYGFGDIEAGEPVQPGSRFRIASVSKALTAVAVLTLVDAGKLALEDRAFPLLALEPPANATVDPRLAAVTVRDLLVHAGGWDSAASGDPQSLPWSRTAAATVGAPDPPDGPAIVRFMLGWGLDFDPGAKSVYSNFGFNVLGRVIEQVAGEGYEDYVAARVLAPAGVADMRLAGTRLAERAPGGSGTTRRRNTRRCRRSSPARGSWPCPTATTTCRRWTPTAAGSRGWRTWSATPPRSTASAAPPCFGRRRSTACCTPSARRARG